MLRRLVLIALLVLVGGSVAMAQQVPSQTSELMLSWRSNGYAPAGYTGRVAAAGGGTVLLVAEEIVAGRPADLSRYEVRWYVNEEFYESGFGMQSISVPIAKFHQDRIDVRVEVIGAPFSTDRASIAVPLTDPLAVIEPRSGTGLHAGQNLFTAAAYSFNVTNPNDLLYNWSIDDDVPQAAEDPRSLTIGFDGLPTGPLDLGLSVSHPQNEGEAAQAYLRVSPEATPSQ